MNDSGFIKAKKMGLPDDAEPLSVNGATCLAYRVRIDGKQFFLKCLRPEYVQDPLYRAMFRKEYEVGMSLKHQHLVHYVDYDELSDPPRILMEYVAGETLAARLQRQPEYFASAQHLQRFLKQLLEVLGYIHSQRIVHLDIKPDNLIFSQVSDDLMLLDLGFCYSDTFGDTLGKTEAFAAPEQIASGEAIDASTDLYAVGRLLLHIQDALPNHRHLPWAFRRIMHRCLNRGKESRYESAQQMLADVNAWYVGCNLYHLLVAALALVALVCVGIGWWSNSGDRKFGKEMQYAYDQSEVPDEDFRAVYLWNEYSVHILSEEDRTCEILRHPEGPQRYNGTVDLPSQFRRKGVDYTVVSIGTNAFLNCRKITQLRLPFTLQRIGKSAFSGCSSMLRMSIPDGVTEIDYEAFHDCRSMEQMRLPKGITRIAPNLFVGTWSLQSVTVPDGVKYVESNAFTGSGVREVILPASIEGIGEGAFWSCGSLRRITLPEHISYIGDHVFWHCDSLLEVSCLNPNPVEISNIFRDTLNLPRVLFVPRESIELYRAAKYWGDFPEIRAIAE